MLLYSLLHVSPCFPDVGFFSLRRNFVDLNRGKVERKCPSHSPPFWYKWWRGTFYELSVCCVSCRCDWVVCNYCLSQQTFTTCHAHMDRVLCSEKWRCHDSKLSFVLVYRQKAVSETCKQQFFLPAVLIHIFTSSVKIFCYVYVLVSFYLKRGNYSVHSSRTNIKKFTIL